MLALSVPVVVGADLTRNAADFWRWSPPPAEDLYRGDGVTAALQEAGTPLRVLNWPGGAYPGSSLMAFRIPQLLGYHGNELHAFDQLMGGKNQWRNLLQPKLWDLYAIRYLVIPAAGGVPDSLPGFTLRERAAPTTAGTEVAVFERTVPPPYAWVATAAVKVDDSTAARTALDARLPKDAVVLLPEDAAIDVAPIDQIPPASGITADVTAWEPGRMTVHLDPAPATPAYLVVAENWYPDWQGTVDGTPVTPLRGNLAQLTVPVPAGAREVELVFRSASYARGRAVSLLSLTLAVLMIVAPLALRGRRG